MNKESEDSNKRNGEVPITRASTIPAVGHDARRVEIPPKAVPIEEQQIDLSTYEKVQLFIDENIAKARLATSVAPHIPNIIGGLMSNNWKTTAAGIVGVIVVLLKTFNIVDLTPETVTGIVTVVTAVGLYFSRDKGSGSDAPKTPVI